MNKKKGKPSKDANKAWEECGLAQAEVERLTERLAETEVLCNGYFDEMHQWAEKYRSVLAALKHTWHAPDCPIFRDVTSDECNCGRAALEGRG